MSYNAGNKILSKQIAAKLVGLTPADAMDVMGRVMMAITMTVVEKSSGRPEEDAAVFLDYLKMRIAENARLLRSGRLKDNTDAYLN